MEGKGSMKKQDKIDVCSIVDNEGFDYAFRDYSEFEEIKDEQFHKLRQAYVEAAQKLDDYIGFAEYLENGGEE